MKIILRGMLTLLIFVSPITFAWNAIGHMVVAHIAYQQLKPEAKNKLDQLVLNLQQEYPDTKSFLEMAYWADALRSQKVETYSRWHYINIAFSKDQTPLKNLIDADNATWALEKIAIVVKNKKSNAYERARFVAFLTHITGDLHQPMHTVALISAEHPTGDRGGNDYVVFYNKQHSNLHRLWDSGVDVLDEGINQNKVIALSKTITTLYPVHYFGNQINDLNPMHWAQEGSLTAQQVAYNTPENEAVSTAYVTKGRQVAQEKLALAGYRLGAMLNQMLG